MNISQRVRYCRPIALVILLLSIVGLAGCNGASTAAIHGKVSLDGEPVEYGSITFTPEKGQAFGAVITDGAYLADRKGVPGRATVVVVAMPKMNTAATPEEIRAGGGVQDAGFKPIPTDHPKQGQSVEIHPGDNEVNFEF
jgi:hypothetical protein